MDARIGVTIERSESSIATARSASVSARSKGSALVAAVGDRSSFKNGHQFAARLGLVPKQRSSGGRARLFGITKRGDRYLRTLLIHGARSALGRVRDKQDPRSLWLGKMRLRRHPNIVAVALANKNARIAWSLLSSDSVYDPGLSVRAA